MDSNDMYFPDFSSLINDTEPDFLFQPVASPPPVASQPPVASPSIPTAYSSLQNELVDEMIRQTHPETPMTDQESQEFDEWLDSMIEKPLEGSGLEGPVFQVLKRVELVTRKAWSGMIEERAIVFTLSHRLDSVKIEEIATDIDAFVKSLVDPILIGVQDADYIALKIDHDELGSPLYVSFTKKANFRSGAVFDKIYKLVQSDCTRFLMDGRLELTVSICKAASGLGNRRSTNLLIEADQFFSSKNDLIIIENDDHMCGYLAITLGYWHSNNVEAQETQCEALLTAKQWRLMREQPSRRLQRETRELFAKQLRIDISEPFNISMAQTVQDRLPEHQLIIVKRPTAVSTMNRDDKPLFMGPIRKKRIILEYVEEARHYNTIKKMEGYKSNQKNYVRKWCYNCWKSIRYAHVCPILCTKCSGEKHEESTSETTCDDCLQTFNSQLCFDNHKINKICGTITTCTTCEEKYNSKSVHKCDTSCCRNCNETYTEAPHYCMLKKQDFAKLQEEDQATKVFCFFDIESELCEVQPEVYEHKAMTLISWTVCDRCFQPGEEKTSSCDMCGELERIYFGHSCVKEFMNDIIERKAPLLYKKVANLIVCAHNFKGYDGRFILTELYSRRLIELNTVFRGTKILMAKVGNIKFIDSLCHLPMSLNQLAKTFPVSNLKPEKLPFPLYFNKQENWGYEGPWPGVEQFPACTPTQKLELQAELDKKQGQIFNFKEEIIKYCRQDVALLTHGYLLFRKSFSECTGLDVTTRTYTLPMSAMEVFRSRCLEEKAIGITPIEGYLAKRKGSVIGDIWLDLQERALGSRLQREKKLGNYFCDGFDPSTNTVYEYFGCYYHGCPFCFPERAQVNTVSKKTMQQLYEATQEKLRYYARRGFPVVQCWDHDIDHNAAEVRERRETLEKIREKAAKMSIRDSLAGGRVENYKLKHACKDNESLRYVDFTSLYPYVLKNRSFPLGHPRVITEGIDPDNFCEAGYFGFAHVKILPPQNLDPPLLPYKAAGKLLFGLCTICMEQGIKECNHSEEQRALDSLYTTAELYKALELGYKILQVYYVLHYDRRSASELFGPYVNMFLKIKQEASGLPPGADIEAYIRAYEQREGIKLDGNNIKKNEGYRAVAKLMLNSLWGKFAQDQNMPNTKIVGDYQTLCGMLEDETIDVITFSIVTEDIVLVTYKKTEEAVTPGNTSPAVACFVTSYARLKLYELMEQVNAVRPGRLAYCDTDSLIFIHQEGDPEVPLGSFLGDLTDEVPAGYRCRKGVFAGAKSYGLEMYNPGTGDIKCPIKIKGITLPGDGATGLDLSAIENLVDQFCQGNVIEERIPQTQFNVKNKADQTIRTLKTFKIFRVTSDKRIVIDAATTRPYGYRNT